MLLDKQENNTGYSRDITEVKLTAEQQLALNFFRSPLPLKQPGFTFIDLFAGLGGTRIGFEQACLEKGLQSKCVFTSEIKDYAVSVYQSNFLNSEINGDITKIEPASIPNFDFLLAGFPCQPFSSAGKRNGFLDERGGLFFTILDILKAKKPLGFLLENVDGLASHNSGETLKVILTKLEELGYQVAWNILDASEFGVPQKRRRIYIVGHTQHTPDLVGFTKSYKTAREFIELDAPVKNTPFTKLLSDKFTPVELFGKSIKDKRGGLNNIHSWDLEVKGSVSESQKEILELILKKRRYKKWAEAKGIDWMDGMPLTIEEISTFYHHPDLKANLEDLTKKGYLTLEHPKKKIIQDGITKRVPHTAAAKGYNIVVGKLSFPLAKIIDPNDVAPTIVATETGKIGVATDKGVRSITVQEGLHLSGFPSSYKITEKNYAKAFDLIGNTVMPPVIKAVALRLLK
ncbi:MAG: DNA (cytosine-5-)-methyltransferase [Methylophilaceae bacterium]